MTDALLNVDELDVRYGEISALRNVNLAVRPSEVVAVIGANGAGKSTLLRTISGIIRPAGGKIRFRGQDISRRRPDQIATMGVIHCPEGRAVLERMSVLENLEMGAFRLGSNVDFESELETVLLLFPRLRERQEQMAASLSGGEQQMLAIGRALMARPEILMIDEPSLGLAPLLVAEVFRVINGLKERGQTVLLVEQNARQALKCADRVYVLENGRVSFHGTAHELQADPRIQSAYLGRAGQRPNRPGQKTALPREP